MFRKGDFDTPEPDPELVSDSMSLQRVGSDMFWSRKKTRNYGDRALWTLWAKTLFLCLARS